MNNDWTTCKIGDICKKICSGGTPKSNEPSYYGGNIPWLNTKEINFIGNVETRDVPYGCCDVLVADGFTGNIILKLYEGVAGAMMANIKSIFKKSSITMLAAMMVKGGLLGLKMRMDYSEFGGAPLLGVNGVVIKAHGSSDAKAIRNAIRQAKTCAEKNIVGTIAQNVKEAADAE